MTTAAIIISSLSIAVSIATQVYLAVEHRRFMRVCKRRRAEWGA